MRIFRKFMIATVFAAMTPMAALAAPVELASEVFVERTETDANGKAAVKLVAATNVVPGDTLRFVINYANASDEAATDFIITNPLPASVAFVGSEGDALVELSVDGSRFGKLASLSVVGDDGTPRAARPDDVTHVRWTFADAIPAGASGTVLYRGRLR
ncbi:MAG: hypothetical protein WA906_05510 [Pacificimonas sp.]